jgi:hypothetical protein
VNCKQRFDLMSSNAHLRDYRQKVGTGSMGPSRLWAIRTVILFPSSLYFLWGQ